MPRILIIDDSKVDRSIAAQALRKVFEVLEADSGQEALETLAATSVDMIILDVNMPDLDGSTTLRELRKQGVEAPVVLVTAEIRTSVIATMMKQGIANYIVKPVEPKDLLEKVRGILNVEADDDKPDPTADVLIVDDMPNVIKKFTNSMPDHLKVVGAGNYEQALEACRNTRFKALVVDMELPYTDSYGLISQLRVFQPDATVYGLYLRDVSSYKNDIVRHGFDGYLNKPFEANQLRDFMNANFDANADRPLTVEGNVLQVNGFPENREQRGAHALRLRQMAGDAVRAIAAACFDKVYIDMSEAPPTEMLLGIVTSLQKLCNDIGLSVELIISLKFQRLIATTRETQEMVMHENRDQALAA